MLASAIKAQQVEEEVMYEVSKLHQTSLAALAPLQSCMPCG